MNNSYLLQLHRN
uniref:Uncharacterized protein n=1 Tax=Arundo donax TaxID=35708 RepID=A0A0A9HDK0_ARUDO